MGGKGPTKSQMNTQNWLSQQGMDYALSEAGQSAADTATRVAAEQPVLAFDTAMTSGNPGAINTAAAPLLANINQGFMSTRQGILNDPNIQKGAARDLALSNLKYQEGTATASTLNNTYLSALNNLAQVGSGIGSFGTAESAQATQNLGVAGQTNQVAMQAASEGKQGMMGILSSLISAGGEIGLGALMSDRDLKKNIQPLQRTTDAIANIPAYSFEYVSDNSGRRRIGVMAQDVMQDFPELIVHDRDGKMMVDYLQLAAVALQAVRELRLEVKQLKDAMSVYGVSTSLNRL